MREEYIFQAKRSKKEHDLFQVPKKLNVAEVQHAKGGTGRRGWRYKQGLDHWRALWAMPRSSDFILRAMESP